MKLIEKNKQREKKVNDRIHVKSSSSKIKRQIKEKVSTSASSHATPTPQIILHIFSSDLYNDTPFFVSLLRGTKTEKKDSKKSELKSPKNNC